MRVRERDLRRLLRVVGPEAVQQMSTKLPPVRRCFLPKSRTNWHSIILPLKSSIAATKLETRQKQQVYVDYFRDRDNVVDIGCGRGEFLEALRDAGIPARGIELGTDQILLCQEKGLDVVQQDLFAFLESTPDESLGGIFSSQVIEHLSGQRSTTIRRTGLSEMQARLACHLRDHQPAVRLRFGPQLLPRPDPRAASPSRDPAVCDGVLRLS